MSSIELLGRRTKIIDMLKLINQHIEYLSEADRRDIRNIAISELKLGKPYVRKRKLIKT